MKKILLTTMMTASMLVASAQCVPFAESDFENWVTIQDTSAIGNIPYTYEKPDTTWTSITDLFSLLFTGTALPAMSKSTDSYSGVYSVNLAAPTAESGNLMGQIFYSARPTKFSGYYKYDGLAGDSLTVSVGGNGDTTNAVLLAPVAVWTPFSVNINYNTMNVPDTFTVLFNLVNHGTTTINAWLDDLCFGDLPTAINETTNETKPSFYNKGENQFVLSLPKTTVGNYTASILNISGQVIYRKLYYSNSTNGVNDEFSLNHLSKGIYILNIKGNDEVFTRKFVVN